MLGLWKRDITLILIMAVVYSALSGFFFDNGYSLSKTSRYWSGPGF
ncbi:hypothetical protein [Erwinia sp. QL-Z3]|nr:hypothetical protein [Erwinia sp. QL-Z3]